MPAESAGPLLTRLGAAGVDLRVASTVVVPEEPAAPLQLAPVFGGEPVDLGPVLTVWHRPRVPVLLPGVVAGEKMSVIGDCLTPRRVSHAIAEGYRLGAEL